MLTRLRLPSGLRIRRAADNATNEPRTEIMYDSATRFALNDETTVLFMSQLPLRARASAAEGGSEPDGSLSRVNIVAAGLGLGGIGVWSMHFVGMLALKLDLATGYALLETLASLLAAVVVASLAFMFVGRDPRLGRITLAGCVLGLGVAVMHYLGMFGMRFGGYTQWNSGIVALSVLIAMAAASAALWLAFNTPTLTFRVAAAMVMGIAVCSMHYTGMVAADFICTTTDRGKLPSGFGVISAADLPVLVLTISIGLAAVIAVDLLLQNLLGNEAAAKVG